MPGRTPGARSAGFTMIEILIVVSIIMILLSIAIPIFSQSILRAREEALRKDLEMLRVRIDQYTLDKNKAPQSLDDLRTAKYIDAIPIDPMTREPNWQVDQEEVIMSIDQQDTGIVDVHSASNAVGSNGQAYSSW